MNKDKEFSQLLEETYRALSFFLRYLGLPEADVDDMAQEVYLKAYNAFDRYESGRSFKAWLFSIAKNTFIDWTRKQKTHRRFLEMNFSKDFCDTFEDSSNTRTQVKAMLEKLSAEEQILIELRFFQDLPFNEVAELAGLTVGAVKMRMMRILDKIKTDLKRESYDQNL
ncbi:MAG: RNA polymerase sigma factor [Candidatus Riflebacteria bacterium]|nr:RNA polymerase sigma factor [Candidatus Riflebacteria bacterium]